MQVNQYHGKPYSEHPKAVAARQRRERDPEAYRREIELARERKKERRHQDPVYLAAHNARNNRRLKERRSAPETWARFALNQIRARAKARNIPFDLSSEDLAPPTHCPVLGFEMVYGGGTGEMRAPSVDRLRPALGYVKGNVRVISRRANSIKNDATADEVQKVADWMKREGL